MAAQVSTKVLPHELVLIPADPEAKFVKVAVNGKTLHENQEAAGPTRAHPLKDEAATGPISIQGDHGPIAIRSFRVKPLKLD